MVASFYLPLMMLAAVVGIGFALFSWRNRQTSGARALTALLVGASFWALAEGLTVSVGQVEAKLFWTRVALALSVVPPLAWLLFALNYTGTTGRISRRLLAVLLLEPILFIALVWTNHRHETAWTEFTVAGVGDGFTVLSLEFGLAFWGHQVYSYLLLVVGMLLVLRASLHANRRVRTQGTMLLGAIAIPGILIAVNLFGPIPASLNAGGVGYILAGLVITMVCMEPELARIAPATRDAGRETVLADLDDAILILDDSNHVIDHNPAAGELLDEDDVLGSQLSTVASTLACRLNDDNETIRLEIDGRVRYFDLRISELSGAYGVLSGRVVSLRDVTDRRQREQRLDVLNRILRHNVRNELNVVRGNIELTRQSLDGDQKRLDDAIEGLDGVIERSNKVGRLSRLLDADENGALDIAAELRGEFGRETRPNLSGRVELDLPAELYVTGGPSLVSAFDELVTNALEHNDSEQPNVRISVDEIASDDTHVVLTVSDNGPGIDRQEVDALADGQETPLQHASGVGLWLVHWLVQRAGGSLSFENTADGCTVRIRLPRATPP